MIDTPQSMSEAHLKNIARDIQDIKSNLLQVINYMHDAEAEVPEKMRRFIMYFHDMHDLVNFYHELGLETPAWISREVERCADRLRHLIEDQEKPGETFEKVRREMSKREGNRYDHTKLLKGNSDETRTKQQQNGSDKGGASIAGGEPASGG